MSIPKATAWQVLRQLCLDAIPLGTSAYYKNATPFHDWFTKGTFHVASCTKKEVVIWANHIEVGTALLSDSQHFLDHAAEQHASFKNLVLATDGHSPAWSVVTAYYWSFFSAMAIARLSGIGPWFVTKQLMSELKTLSSANEQPHPGALTVSVGKYLNSTEREVTLRPSRLQLHEALWNRISDLFSKGLSAADEAANSLEYRLFHCVRDATRWLEPAWPIKIRNIVNYVPGCAYREIIRDREIDVARYIRKRTPLDCAKLISQLEDLLATLNPQKPAQHTEEIPTRCRLLVLFSILLWMMARQLLAEVVEGNSSNRRWLTMRNEFLQRNCGAEGCPIWPSTEE